MEQFITSKKLLPFSGNCIAFRDLKYHMPDFLKDKILKSPLSWTFSLYGILSLLDVFNGRFKKTIDRYYQLHIQPEEDPHFCGNVIYTAPNESENLHESQLKYTIAAFEYVHLDVFKKIEELKRRVDLMEEYIKDENVFFVYSVNDIDCNYLTENDIKFFIFLFAMHY